MAFPRRRIPHHPRYEILRKLGSGGTSSVFLARDLLDDSREVALKVCRLEIAPEQVLREFRILRELRHPGIARSFDFGRLPGDGAAYFTLEYIAGPDIERESSALRREARRGDVAPLLGIFLQVTSALGYLHRKGLLHLDLKPSNVVVSAGRAKLIDFGLFQNAQVQDARPALGTSYFMAPEVLDGGPVDRRADLYSLGVTLYRSFTGRYPIPGRTLSEVAENHRHFLPLPPVGIPDGLARIILKLLAKSPQHRFQSAEEVSASLRALTPGAEHLGDEPPDEIELTGRKRELDAFFSWFGRLKSGGTKRIFLIEGEPGTGKSRLADACVTEMLGMGARVVPLRSFSGKDSDGLRLLVEKVLTLRPLSAREKTQFKFLLTVLGITADESIQREIADLDLDQIRARVFKEGLELLAVCVPPPTVIVIEDVHQADLQLQDFIRRFAEAADDPAQPTPPGLLVTCRTGRNDGFDFAAQVREKMESIQLENLSRDESLDFLKKAAPALERGEMRRIVRMTHGNPALLVERLRRKDASDEEAPIEAGSPGGEALRARWETLDENARVLFLHSRLLERPAEEALLRKVTGMPLAALRGARLGLERGGLLKGSRSGLYVDQRAVSELGTSSFDESDVREAHGRIGRALLKDPGRLREAAHHLLLGGETDQGLKTSEQAVIKLRLAGRVEEALAACLEALAHGSDAALKLRLTEAAGELEEKCGRFDDAGSRYESLLTFRQLRPVDRLRVLRKLGGIRQRRGENEDARQTFEEALQLLDAVDDVGEHLYLFQELSALYLFRGDFSRAATFANRGLEILASERARKLTREAQAHHALNFHSAAGHVLLRQYEHERAAEEFLRGLELAERLDSLTSTALILNNLGIAYGQDNRLSEALRVYGRAAAIARKMGDGTALFSVQCNVAMIRARLGELGAAGELLEEARRLPHARRSKRAQLFLLHSQALVERLAMTDARPIWEKAIRLADELPDPLFASHGRVYLLENEIHHGRWNKARELATELEKAKGRDARLDRAVAARQAWLEALCGRREEAGAILASAGAGTSSTAYADLWDSLYFGCALLELGELARAEEPIERILRVFERSRQIPSALECTLLLADIELRSRKSAEALKKLRDASKLLAQQNGRRGFRNALVRIPFLEARCALQQGTAGEGRIQDRLVDAAGNLGPDSTAEVVWLLDLVAAESNEPPRLRRCAQSRRRFAAGLMAADRKSYLARDHRTRLGLTRAQETDAALAAGSGAIARRYEALLKLRSPATPRQALLSLLEGANAPRGAIFLEAEPGVAAAQGFDSKKRAELESLRREALRARSGRVNSGMCFDIPLASKPRAGVVYVEPSNSGIDAQDTRFLATASRLLGFLLEAQHSGTRPLSETTPGIAEKPLETKTISSSGFGQSESPRMKDVIEMVLRTRESQLPVLITGESGTGKDHLARWIHSISPRARGPFVAQDCSAIPEGLLEADIFGYETGAFTGADRSKTGYIFAAEGGTYYLDNVDSISLDVQAKLLRILEEKAVRPLGAHGPRKTDVRIIASSQRDLKELSLRGELRKDLYFRLAGICLQIPPLRERAEDIPGLLRDLLRQIPGPAPELTPGAIEALKTYAWPGNVRELESLVRRLAITSEGRVDETRVAQVLGLQGAPPSFPRWYFDGKSFEQAVDDVKREYLLQLFERFGGDLDKIAREMKTTKRNVYFRFSQAGLRPMDLREG